MATKYKCPCSKCDVGSRSISQRTIEAHLLKDQMFLGCLQPGTDSALFVKSCIDRTIQFLSQLNGGTSVLDPAPGADGSRPEGSEGVFLKS